MRDGGWRWRWRAEEGTSLLEARTHQMGIAVLVEEDQSLRAAIAMLLQRLGFGVLAVSDCASALDTAGEIREPVQILVLDVHDDALTGLTLCLPLIETAPFVPVIVICVEREDVMRLELGKFERVRVLVKPFRAHQFRVTVAELLGG